MHRRVLEAIFELAEQLGLAIKGMIPSPLLGPAGNAEFLIWCRRHDATTIDAAVTIERALESVKQIKRSVQ